MPFKLGAFAPGVPVQPVIVRFPYTYIDPSWTAVTPALPALIFRLMSSLWQSATIEYLPVLHPSAEEQENPQAFARRARLAFTSHAQLNPNFDDVDADDVFLSVKAAKLKLPRLQDILVGKRKVQRVLSLPSSFVYDCLVRFSELDVYTTGTLTAPDGLARLANGHAALNPEEVSRLFDVMRDTETTVTFKNFMLTVALFTSQTLTPQAIQVLSYVCGQSPESATVEVPVGLGPRLLEDDRSVSPQAGTSCNIDDPDPYSKAGEYGLSLHCRQRLESILSAWRASATPSAASYVPQYLATQEPTQSHLLQLRAAFFAFPFDHSESGSRNEAFSRVQNIGGGSKNSQPETDETPVVDGVELGVSTIPGQVPEPSNAPQEPM